ncbi:MAG: ABC transporter permease [Candidatus Thorarchaeota archaeon]
MKRAERYGSLFLFFLPIGFLTLMFLIPLLLILQKGILDLDGIPTAEYLLFVFNDEITWIFFKFTLIQAIVSTILTVCIGLPGAYFFARYEFRGKKLLRTLLTVPFVLPPIVVLLGFIALFGSKGPARDLLAAFGSIFFFYQENPPDSLFDPILFPTLEILGAQFSIPGIPIGILLAHTFYNVPIVIRLVSSILEQRDPTLEEVADTLGSKGFHRFRRLFVSQILPGLLASSFLTFFYCFTSFALVLYLGGVRYQTLDVRIFTVSRRYYQEDYLHIASALAIIQLLVCFSLVFLYYFLLRETTSRKVGRIERAPAIEMFRDPRVQLKTKIAFLSYLTLILLFLLSPLAAVVSRSLLIEGSFSLDAYRVLFDPSRSIQLHTSPRQQVANSLIYAIATLVIATFLGICSAAAIHYFKRQGKNKTAFVYMIMILAPMAASGVTLGLGMLRIFGSEGLSQYGLIFLVSAHTLAALPFVNRAISAAYEKIDPELTQVSRSLGASSFRTFFRVELPLLAPGIIAAAVFALAISFGEFGATYFISTPDQSTMTVGIYQLLDLRRIEYSAAMATMLIIVCVASFLIIDKAGRSGSLF